MSRLDLVERRMRKVFEKHEGMSETEK